MRKILHITLYSILCMFLSFSVYADEGETIVASGALTDYVSWELSTEGELRIYGSNIIPEYAFGNYPWDSYSDDITSVKIESGITKIPNDLFSQKTNIFEV